MITDLQVRLGLPDARADDFWSAALGWPLDPTGPGDGPAVFQPRDGDGYVQRRRVVGPPRVELVLEVDDLAGETDRLLGLGARPDRSGTTLRSPGGWGFVLAPQRPRSRPGPTRWPAGHRSRAVQVCLDAPPARLPAELDFWSAATGWPVGAVDAPGFAGRLVAPGRSVQLLLQQLGAGHPGPDVVRGHLDLGADDIGAEATRLAGLGAERRWAGDGWVTLRDPAGMLFCATETSPDAP